MMIGVTVPEVKKPDSGNQSPSVSATTSQSIKSPTSNPATTTTTTPKAGVGAVSVMPTGLTSQLNKSTTQPTTTTQQPATTTNKTPTQLQRASVNLQGGEPPPTIGSTTKSIELPDKPGEAIPISAAGVGNLKNRFEGPGGTITQGRPTSGYSAGRPASGYGSGGGGVTKPPPDSAPPPTTKPTEPTTATTTTPTTIAPPPAVDPPPPAVDSHPSQGSTAPPEAPPPVIEQPVETNWDIRIALWDFAGNPAESQLPFNAGAVVRLLPAENVCVSLLSLSLSLSLSAHNLPSKGT